MTIAYAVRAPRDADEMEAFVAHACDAFLGSAAHTRSWISRAGEDRVRIVHDGKRVVGGLAAVRCGQFWGGRSVSNLAVAGIAVGAEYRGRGAASALMRECLREARADGSAISTLYASNHALYRGVGYEPAGATYELETRVHEIGGQRTDAAMRVATAADEPALRALYHARAARRNGHLERAPFHWHHARHVRDATCRVSLVEEDGRPTGYVAYHQRRTGDVLAEMIVTDLVASTPTSLRRLLSFLRSHGSQIGTATLQGADLDHEVIHAMREPFIAVKRFETWMLRVLDVPAALTARGYAASVTGSAEFEIDDPLFDENCGRWTIEVSDGRAQVERGGSGSVQLDIRGLAPLYTGFATPESLELRGLGSGLAHLPDGLFAGPPPVCADMY